jgi:SAM-dependent methyltransferase
MTAPKFRDYFSTHAADYRAFRPQYPKSLFAHLASIAPARRLAWDCGTGNGQAAVGLAAHFERVLATDASADQVKNAEPHPGIEYAVACAEECPLPDRSADLVTVAQALHWFDFDRFYAEVGRVAKPRGILAVWTYELHSVNPSVDTVLHRFQNDFVGAYWPPDRVWVDTHYRSIPFPFPELPAPEFEMTEEWELPRMLGYMSTWSATKGFIRAKGYDPVERLAEEFAMAWGEPSMVRTVRWRLTVRIGRVE